MLPYMIDVFTSCLKELLVFKPFIKNCVKDGIKKRDIGARLKPQPDSLRMFIRNGSYFCAPWINNYKFSTLACSLLDL